MTQPIMVIAEQTQGAFRKVTFEALSAAQKLANATAAQVYAMVLGNGIAAAAPELAQYGAAKIIVADDPALAEFTTEAFTSAVAEAISQIKPSLVIFGATTKGRDLAARLSARIDAGLANDCIDVRVEAEKIIATRPMYGGKILADVALDGSPILIALRPNSLPVVARPAAGEVETITLTFDNVRTQVVGKHMESGKVELTEADIVISGGRGMGGSDYSIIEALAEVLGGAVGASRSAVDEGWRPASDQVGQTGKTVSPNLYIACGISGAIQHLAGMSSSKVIVAINKDPEAPLITKADYAIIGDLFEVVPALTEEIKRVKG